MNSKFVNLVNSVVSQIEDIEILNVEKESKVYLNRKMFDRNDDLVDILIVLEIINHGTAREMFQANIKYKEKEILIKSKNTLGIINGLDDGCDNIIKETKKSAKDTLTEEKNDLVSYLLNKGYMETDITTEVTSIKAKIDVKNSALLSFRLDINREGEDIGYVIVEVKENKVKKELDKERLYDELDKMLEVYEDYGKLTVVIEHDIYSRMKKLSSKKITTKGYKVKEMSLLPYDEIEKSFILLDTGKGFDYLIGVKIEPSEFNPSNDVYRVFGKKLIEKRNSIEKDNNKEKELVKDNKEQGNKVVKKSGNAYRQFKTDNNRMLALINYVNLNKDMLLKNGVTFEINKKGDNYLDYEVIFRSRSGYFIIVRIDKIFLLNRKDNTTDVLFARKLYTAQTKEMKNCKKFISGINNIDDSYKIIVKSILDSFNLKNKYQKKGVIK